MTHKDYEDYYDDITREDRWAQIRRIVTAFIVGGLISSVVTLFITPTTGQELRRNVRRTMEDVQNKAGQAKEAVTHAPQRAKSAMNDATETAKRRASMLKEVGGNMVEEQVESLKQGAGEAADVIKSG